MISCRGHSSRPALMPAANVVDICIGIMVAELHYEVGHGIDAGHRRASSLVRTMFTCRNVFSMSLSCFALRGEDTATVRSTIPW